MTVKEFCDLQFWSISELSRRADISFPTADRAYKRKPTDRITHLRILKAFNEVRETPLKEEDIDW